MKRSAVVSTLAVILAGALVVATRSEGKMEKMRHEAPAPHAAVPAGEGSASHPTVTVRRKDTHGATAPRRQRR